MNPEFIKEFDAWVTLRNELVKVMRTDAIPEWMNTANPALGGERPADVWTKGDRYRVWRLVEFLGSGMPT